eukprot:tig00020801_g13944.t1
MEPTAAATAAATAAPIANPPAQPVATQSAPAPRRAEFATLPDPLLPFVATGLAPREVFALGERARLAVDGALRARAARTFRAAHGAPFSGIAREFRVHRAPLRRFRRRLAGALRAEAGRATRLGGWKACAEVTRYLDDLRADLRAAMQADFAQRTSDRARFEEIFRTGSDRSTLDALLAKAYNAALRVPPTSKPGVGVWRSWRRLVDESFGGAGIWRSPEDLARGRDHAYGAIRATFNVARLVRTCHLVLDLAATLRVSFSAEEMTSA